MQDDYNKDRSNQENNAPQGYEQEPENRNPYEQGDYNDGRFDQNGFDPNGYQQGGFDPNGYRPEDYDRDGFGFDGYGRDDYQREDTPRWTPFEEPYQTVTKPEKPRKRWVIPLIIGVVFMAITSSIAAVYGSRQLGQWMQMNPQNPQNVQNQNPAPSEKGEATISISDKDKSDIASHFRGIVLTDVSDVVEEAIPSVVSITSRSLVDSGYFGNFNNIDDIFDYFFNGGISAPETPSDPQEVDTGIGSGTIISKNDEELLILTSYHVVEGSSSLYVTFYDDASVDGYIKSQSAEDDIAIVAVPLSDIAPETMEAVKIARMSSTPAEVGEGVIVIGNALGYGMSVTTGIVSATNRVVNVDGKTLTLLQTDAAINQGNSGGCLLNGNGDIIGISEAKVSDSLVEGMCYAIPVSSNTELIKTLLNSQTGENGAVVSAGEGAYLGIRGRNVDSSLANSYGMPKGVFVASTVAGSGAAEAGIQPGDIIVGMDNVSFTTMEALQEQLAMHNPGDVVTLIIMREIDGSYTQHKIEIMLTEMIG